jgi:hypothetical protein
MFAKQLIRLSHVAFGAAILGVTVIATPAQAADPVTPTASVMNQSNGVYEETLKFYLHPARLEVTEAPRERMDHRGLSSPGRKLTSTGRVRSSFTRHA